MALNPSRRAALVATCVLLAALWATSQAGARFADAAGFSGKIGGQTCLACHTIASPDHNDARALLQGVPITWTTGASYALRIRIQGGPAALPSPQAQGGFDIATDLGHFAITGNESLLRMPSPQEVTYLPAGTHQREWSVTWVAPNLDARPAVAHFWLAVLAANGNHLLATNATDQGELFDAADAITALAAPDAATLTAWEGLPLAPPSLDVAVVGHDVTVTGTLGDANATRLVWRLDAEPWSPRDATPEWRLRLPGLPAGDHVLTVRTDGSGRSSPPVSTAFHIDGAAQALGARASPSLAGTIVPIVLILAASWRQAT